MAFPAIEAVGETNGSAAATNKVCNLPAGIVSGDLLILLLRAAGDDTHSTPTDWTPGPVNNKADASNDTQSIFYRVADGTEGGTVTVNGTASLKFAAICWRITGDDGTIQWSADATGTSATPNPAALTPTGGAKDYLWLWTGGWEGEQTSPPAGNPTNYSNPIGAGSGTGGAVATNCRVAGASRQLNAATEDPPSWTISVSDDWTAWTVAVPPAGGALLEGSIGMTATLVGALTTVITMAGTAAANLAAAAVLTTQITLGGAVAGQVVPVAALTTEIHLAGAVAGQLSPSGDLTAPQQALLEGQIAGTLSGAGALTTEIRLAGTAAGGATLAGDLLTSIQLAGVASGTLQAAGDLTTAIQLEGSVAWQLVGAANLETAITLAGQAAGQLAATGDLTAGGVLDGTIGLALAPSGALTTAIPLSGALAWAASLGGDLSTAIILAGLLEGRWAGAGDLTPGIPYAGFGHADKEGRVSASGQAQRSVSQGSSGWTSTEA